MIISKSLSGSINEDLHEHEGEYMYHDSSCAMPAKIVTTC